MPDSKIGCGSRRWKKGVPQHSKESKAKGELISYFCHHNATCYTVSPLMKALLQNHLLHNQRARAELATSYSQGDGASGCFCGAFFFKIWFCLFLLLRIILMRKIKVPFPSLHFRTAVFKLWRMSESWGILVKKHRKPYPPLSLHAR